MFDPDFMRLTEDFKYKALHWADSFSHCCVLDSNGYADPYGQYDLLIAAGASCLIQPEVGDGFKQLKNSLLEQGDWMFGILSYELKNETERLSSANPDKLTFPELCFFRPEYLIIAQGGELRVLIGEPEILEYIDRSSPPAVAPTVNSNIHLHAKMTKAAYLEKIERLQQHIARGDVYEVTFCQEFYAEAAAITPLSTYLQLNTNSPTPFSAYLKLVDKYLLCASPERFLRKKGTQLISQPIKGTAKRSKDQLEDLKIKENLRADLKEQTENVMIVDLVRNDLTKSAVAASVQVAEQFGIYSFAQVHQMISTISCEMRPELHPVDAIRNTFPMGSMTGAPKVRAMELIETYEESKRGAYSGAIGYISPAGDFDLNVVIRSILYAKDQQYLSFQVGSAITAASVPEKEYEECMLKASAIIKTIKGPQ